MTTRSFKIASYLGKSISTGVIEQDGGFSEAGVTASGGGGSALNVYETLDSLPSSGFSSGDQAYVKGNNRFYINNGSGWYNASLVNAAPFWDSAPQAAYTIEDSATALIVTAIALDSDNPSSIISYTGFASDSAQYLVNITIDSSVTTFTPLSADSVANNATLGNIPDSNGGDFTYTFRATDGISTVSQASTITYSLLSSYTNDTYTNLNITNWDFGTAGTNVTSYNSSTKIEGSHSGYISGGGNINRQPGKGQGETAVTFSSAYCIAMWVNVSAYNGSYNVAFPWNHGGKASAGNSYGPCALMLKTDGTVEFVTDGYTGSAYSGITVDVGTLTTSTWYHIIAAATPGGSTIKLWVSEEGGSFGGLANQSGFTSVGIVTGSVIENLIVGDGSNNWYLHGSIGNAADNSSIYYDDVRIYDAVPTDAEAQAIFETNGDLTSSSNPLTTNLRFAYQFNNTRSAGIA